MVRVGDTLGGCDRPGLEMHLDDMIMQEWKSTSRL